MQVSYFLNSINPLFSSNDKAKIHLTKRGVSRFNLQKDVFQKTSNVNFKSANTEFTDYENTEKFANYYEAKLRKDLKCVSEKDILSIISEVSRETQTEPKKVQEVIDRLTKFSGYKQLPAIGQAMLDAGAQNIYDLNSLSLNQTLSYVGLTKKQFALKGNPDDILMGKDALFIDNFLLTHLKSMKKNNSKEFENIKKKIKKGDIRLFNIDGFNVKLAGKYCSYGMFGKELSLKDLTQKVIEKMSKNNLSLDETLNADIINETKALFGDDVNITNIKSLGKTNSVKDIVDNINPKFPNAENIKNTIDFIVKKYSGKNFKQSQEPLFRAMLAKYFDVQSKIYSSENLPDDLRKHYKNIKSEVAKLGKTMDDVFYCVPKQSKSFTLIAYQYAKLNHVKPEKFVNFDAFQGPKHPEFKNKVLVVLDDFAGSGQSLGGEEFCYGFCACDYKSANIILAPVVSTQQGYDFLKQNIDELNRTKKDKIIAEHIIKTDSKEWLPEKFKDEFNKLTKKERDLIVSACLGLTVEEYKAGSDVGFNTDCVAFPYMIPDNSSLSTSLMFRMYLNNQAANKTLDIRKSPEMLC